MHKETLSSPQQETIPKPEAPLEVRIPSAEQQEIIAECMEQVIFERKPNEPLISWIKRLY